MIAPMHGHVHVISGDITALACDAWLLPTDEVFRVSRSFAKAAGVEPNHCVEGQGWAGSRVVPLAGDRTGPAIWLGNVGLDEASVEWHVGVVEPYVAQAMEDLAGIRRMPLLALPVVGTGEGGMAADKGAIYQALLPELLRCARAYQADLVLVCRDRRSYSAAQRVRRRLLDQQSSDSPTWDLGERATELVAAAERLGREARRQNVVLFMGAGVSVGAGLPAWQQLLDGLAHDLEFSDDALQRLRHMDVRDQAAILQLHLGADSASEGQTLHDAVSAQLGDSSHALVHGLLASLPCREAVTTNYDRLFEIAAQGADGAPLAVLPYQAVEPGQRWLLKLHGSVDQADSIVLTRDDYLRIPTSHGALFGLVQAMLLTRRMLFVGYSLSDDDFHQIVREVRMARRGVADVESLGTLGTVLTLFDDDFFSSLWPDLEVVAIAPHPGDAPTDTQVAAAARLLQIFCDRVAFESSDLDAYLLDPTYEELLDDDELALAEALSKLDVDPETSSGARVQRLLEEFGGEGQLGVGYALNHPQRSQD